MTAAIQVSSVTKRYGTSVATLRKLNRVRSVKAGQTIVVPVLNDGFADGTKTFQVLLSNPTGGAALGTRTTASSPPRTPRNCGKNQPNQY